jgi:hypothetical protein
MPFRERKMSRFDVVRVGGLDKKRRRLRMDRSIRQVLDKIDLLFSSDSISTCTFQETMPAKTKRKAVVEESAEVTLPAKRTRKSAAVTSTPAPIEKPAKKTNVKSKTQSTKSANKTAKTNDTKTKKVTQKAAVSKQSEKSADRAVKKSAKTATESTKSNGATTVPSPVDLSSITNPLRKFEIELTQKLGPSTMVFGVDEAGRGPLAGPVVAACCYVPLDVDIAGVRDSKDIVDEAERETIYEELIKHPRIRWAAHVNSHERIDEINILQVRKPQTMTLGPTFLMTCICIATGDDGINVSSGALCEVATQ